MDKELREACEKISIKIIPYILARVGDAGGGPKEVLHVVESVNVYMALTLSRPGRSTATIDTLTANAKQILAKIDFRCNAGEASEEEQVPQSPANNQA